ncbi:GNAT family N-acetyltransferase [Kitasatospora purpeofusca]|uniref:GNAT family N-acetyltransferase n=1 Tax=Kitasatospora purpeofusca TaxID=67352 RepID=UPI00367C8D25
MGESVISGLVRSWVGGWVVSRGAAEPVDEPWGWTVDVGQSAQVARHVLPEPTEPDVRKLVAATTAPGTWLKVFTDDDTVRPWLGPGWRFDVPGYLMTVPLAAGGPVVPAGYTLTTWERGGVVRALVRTGAGHFAARGQLGLAGAVAVADQIETAPAHRRRGLGSVVMRALEDAGHRGGAETGFLVATPEGKALYSTLGWTLRATMASLYYAPDAPDAPEPAAV